MASCEDLPPFYGPLQEVNPSSDDLLCPALVQEIENFKPIPGEDINDEGRVMRNDKFEGACRSLFQPNRFYVNMAQLEQVAHHLVGLWGKKRPESKQRAVQIYKHKMTIECSFITWQMHLVPVKGKGKGDAYRIMAGLDLKQAGLAVIKIRDSSGHKHSNPWYLATPRSKTPPSAAVKREEDQPYGPLAVGLEPSKEAESKQKNNKALPRSVTPTACTPAPFKEGGKKNAPDARGSEKTSVVDLSRAPSESPDKDADKGQRKDPEEGKRASSDAEIVTKDGDSIPVHKTLLAAASPTLKQIFEFGGAYSKLQWTEYPTNVVKAALEATYGSGGNPLSREMVETLKNDLELCLRLASEYQLVKFQRLVHKALQNRLSIGNLKTALLEAQKTGDQTLKQGCFKFVQQHAHAVLTDKNIVLLAVNEPDLWGELVRAVIGDAKPSSQARTGERSETRPELEDKSQSDMNREERSKRSRTESRSPLPGMADTERESSNKRQRSSREEEKAWNLEGCPPRDVERIACNTNMLSHSPVVEVVGGSCEN